MKRKSRRLRLTVATSSVTFALWVVAGAMSSCQI
jgi:hypothetical protein